MKERRGRSGVKLKYTRRQENKGGRGGGEGVCCIPQGEIGVRYWRDGWQRR